MKYFMVEIVYNKWTTLLDISRVVAITKPMNGRFLIYFEYTMWTVNESEFEKVYNAFMSAHE